MAAPLPSIQLRSPISEDRDLGARGFHRVQVDAHGQQRLGLAALDQRLTPRINHRRRTEEGDALSRAHAVAGGDETLVLDGPAAQKRAPVHATRVRPLCRQNQQTGPHQRVAPEQFGEAQVITDRQARAAPRQLMQRACLARRQVLFFFHQPEEVDLAVGRGERTIRPVKRHRIVKLVTPALQQRPGQPYAVVPGQAGEAAEPAGRGAGRNDAGAGRRLSAGLTGRHPGADRRWLAPGQADPQPVPDCQAGE